MKDQSENNSKGEMYSRESHPVESRSTYMISLTQMINNKLGNKLKGLEVKVPNVTWSRSKGNSQIP